MIKSKRKCLAGFFLVLIVLMVIQILINTQYKERSITADEKKTVAVYYLLNIDGMKGLGHSALMFVDGQGNGRLYSYNGMQYSLGECLIGKEGIGKMMLFELDSECVNQFLENGNLDVPEESECDNYDRALYTYISNEEYETIKEKLAYYIEVGDTYQQLYVTANNMTGEAQNAAEVVLQEYTFREDIPKYQIYHHNCDVVAREAIAMVNCEMQAYNEIEEKLFPSANYKNMCRQFGDSWGMIHLGQDTVLEKILWYIF